MSLLLGSAGRRATVLAATAGLTLAALASGPVASADQPNGDDNDYAQVNLVSDQPGMAPVTDPNLVNPWGLSQGPSTPVWVSDNGTDVTTLYLGGGAGQTPVAVPLVVAIPDGAPTGQVFNGGTGFRLSNGLPARFIFAGEDGHIAAWNPQLTPITSAVEVATVPGGVFKGMAMLSQPSGDSLLVADFGQGRIAAFDSAFQPVTLPSWAFRDPSLPKGYSPFNVAVIGSRVFVSYAVRNPVTNDDVAGAALGIVDVYGADGMFLRRFASHGPLNSPWAMAVAPAQFGAFSGDLLVGNFGDGRIHAYDPWSGHLQGTLRDSRGRAIAIDGLWGLLPGNGTSAGVNDVLFSAGPQDESHGLLGVLRAAGDDQ